MSYFIYCIKKLLRSPTFWASVVGTAVICLFSEIYYSPLENISETVIGMYSKYTRKALLEDTSLCSYAVFSGGFGVWAAMFAPVVAALASIGICVDERKSGMWRFALHRAGRLRYTVGGCAFVLLSGGLALTFGYGLFGIMAAIMFPPLSAYPAESAAMFAEFTFREGSAMAAIFGVGGLPLCTAAQLGETFIFGSVSSAAAMLLSSFCENKYIVICTPFFLKYSLSQISSVLSVKALEDPMNYNERLLKFANTIQPDGINYFLSYSENTLVIVILNAAFLMITAVLFCVIRGRRLKSEA